MNSLKWGLGGKSGGESLRWFESTPHHQFLLLLFCSKNCPLRFDLIFYAIKLMRKSNQQGTDPRGRKRSNEPAAIMLEASVEEKPSGFFLKESRPDSLNSRGGTTNPSLTANFTQVFLTLAISKNCAKLKY